MAVLYVFPVSGTEFIQINDQNNDYITSIHYAELSFGLDSNGNVQFSHRRESAQLFPIQAAPFAEVLNQAGTPYSVVSLAAFVAAFTTVLPLAGTGGAPSACKVDMQTIAGAATVVTQATAIELQVVALVGTFDITDTNGLANTTTFPINTVGGGVIAEFSLSAVDGAKLEPITIDVPIGATVLIIQKF